MAHPLEPENRKPKTKNYKPENHLLKNTKSRAWDATFIVRDPGRVDARLEQPGGMIHRGDRRRQFLRNVARQPHCQVTDRKFDSAGPSVAWGGGEGFSASISDQVRPSSSLASCNSPEPALLVRTRTNKPLLKSRAVFTNGAIVSSPQNGLTVIASGMKRSSDGPSPPFPGSTR
jgi:hypothetical protein